MKRLLPVALLIVFALLSAGVALWADEKVIVAGEPPITAFAVDCHIRLFEFVLNTRMTVAQKDIFLEEVTKECQDMSAEEKADFLEAIALVDSLGKLDEEGIEEMQAELAEDFAKAAAETPEDAASQLFFRLQSESSQKFLEEGEVAISVQAVDGFIEYLAFLAQPDQPVWFSASATASIKDILLKNFVGMSKAEKEALEDFHAGWYMIRAAWQNVEDQTRKESWRKLFASCGIKAGSVPDITMIKAALAAKIYGEMLDEAGNYGVEPYEWAAEAAVRVW